ncbi:MAG: beta strand repeat-containing protein, partial [Pseudomonas sp.]
DANTAGIQLIGSAATINSALAAATFTATKAGTASIGISVSDGIISSPVTDTYNLSVNTAPTIAGIPASAHFITQVGQSVDVDDVTVADVDGDNLTVTLIATNGTLGGLTDADTNTAGIQLSGSAATINSALAAATFTATQAGAASVDVSVSDGIVSVPTTDTYSFAVNATPTLEAPTAISFNSAVYSINNVNIGPGSEYFRAISSADINGDGFKDLLAVNPNSDTVYTLINNGDSTFTYGTEYTFPNPNNLTNHFGSGSIFGLKDIASADFNNDGRIDFATLNTKADASVTLFINGGNGAFSVANQYGITPGLDPIKITADDFNNDGSPDLFLVNESGSSISVLINKNDGTGTFLTSVNYAVGNNPLDGYSVDINNDGYKDIVTSNSNGLSPIRGLSTFINNGDGTFANPINHSLNYIPFGLASADLNNDGNADLAIIGTETTNYSRVLSIMLGNGDGTYTAHTDEVPNYSPADIKIADLNNDGIADLAVKAYDALYLHFNDGSASFTPEEFSVSFYSEELAAADLNNDNQIDFAYAHLQSGNIEVLTNSTGVVPTVFTEQTPIAVNSLFIISDADGNSDWNGGTLAFQITQNAESSDNLSLPNSNPGNDGIWLDGVQLKAGSTVIGTASAASVSNGSAWTFTFNGNATNALVQATARAVIFDNSSDAPGANNRIITVTATDKNGAISTLAQPIEITLVNDAPVISNLNTDSVAWAGVGNSVLLDASTAVTISDAENGASDWNNCVLKVQRYVGSVATPLGTDIFSFDGDSGFTVNGSNLEDNSTAFASFTNSNGELAITFNTNATATLIQSVMGAINYRNDKPTGDTLIRFTLTDQDNGATTADVTV